MATVSTEPRLCQTNNFVSTRSVKPERKNDQSDFR